MHITTTKSKNAESFYITKTYKTNTGATTSKIVRKLGTLQELSEKLDTDREGVTLAIYWKKYNICDTMKLYKEVCLYGIYQTNTNRGRILQRDDK